MSLNAEPLGKILQLEQSQGYADSVVFGGLDRFLRNWAGQAIASITSPQLINRFHKLHLVNSSYASLTKQQRKEWVKSVLDFLAEQEHRDVKKRGAKPTPIASRSSPRSRGRRPVVNQ